MIQHLIQKTSTSNYIVKFQKYVNFTKWNNVVFMTMFRREFKNNVKNELMRDEALIINLEIMIEQVVDLNNRFYERVMKKRNTNEHQKRADSYIWTTKSKHEKQYNNFKTIFMKLNVISRSNEKNSKRKQEKTDKTCYNYDKTNHFARDCRSKNMMKKKQINVLLKKEFEKKCAKKNHNKTFNFFNIDSNKDEYYLIKYQKICNKFWMKQYLNWLHYSRTKSINSCKIKRDSKHHIQEKLKKINNTKWTSKDEWKKLKNFSIKKMKSTYIWR